MMNVGRIGNWLQVSANLGILAGLVLVGFQMQQNSDLLRTQLSYQESSRYIQNEQVMWGENPAEVWAKSIESPSDLTLAEQRIVESILWVNVEEWRAAYRLSKIGLLGNEWKERVTGQAGYMLGNDYGRAWWKSSTEGEPSNEFVETVNSVLAASPNHTAEFFSEVMEELGEAK
jgi:hypothetical protein